MDTNLSHSTHKINDNHNYWIWPLQSAQNPPSFTVGQRSWERESDGKMERGGGDKDLGLVAWPGMGPPVWALGSVWHPQTPPPPVCESRIPHYNPGVYGSWGWGARKTYQDMVWVRQLLINGLTHTIRNLKWLGKCLCVGGMGVLDALRQSEWKGIPDRLGFVSFLLGTAPLNTVMFAKRACVCVWVCGWGVIRWFISGSIGD